MAWFGERGLVVFPLVTVRANRWPLVANTGAPFASHVPQIDLLARLKVDIGMGSRFGGAHFNDDRIRRRHRQVVIDELFARDID